MRIFDNAYGTGKYICPLDLDAPDYHKRETISNLFTYLDEFMNTIMIELQRIDDSNKQLDTMANMRIEKFEERLYFTALWADYYFFLNTVERTYRLAAELYDALGEHDKKKEIKESNTFNDVRHIRNCIEHLYEDVSKNPAFYTQHRSMGPENKITIDGVSFDASESSLQLLYQIYDDISNIITKRYIVPNKEMVDQMYNLTLTV